MSRRQAGGQLPETPGVCGELSVEIGRLPGTAAIPAQLHAADPARAGKGDATELDRPRRHGRPVRRAIDARHRLDDRAFVPAVVLPVPRLVAGREADPRHPLGLLHAVMARKEEAGWKAMLRGEGRAIEMRRENVVRRQLGQPKAFGVAVSTFHQHPDRLGWHSGQGKYVRDARALPESIADQGATDIVADARQGQLQLLRWYGNEVLVGQ